MGKCFLAKPVNLENLDTIDGRSLNLVLCLALPKLTKMVYFFLPDVAVDVFVVVFRDVQFDGALAPVDALGILPLTLLVRFFFLVSHFLDLIIKSWYP